MWGHHAQALKHGELSQKEHERMMIFKKQKNCPLAASTASFVQFRRVVIILCRTLINMMVGKSSIPSATI